MFKEKKKNLCAHFGIQIQHNPSVDENKICMIDKYSQMLQRSHYYFKLQNKKCFVILVIFHLEYCHVCSTVICHLALLADFLSACKQIHRPRQWHSIHWIRKWVRTQPVIHLWRGDLYEQPSGVGATSSHMFRLCWLIDSIRCWLITFPEAHITSKWSDRLVSWSQTAACETIKDVEMGWPKTP
jgi:hypothetical protein